MSSEYQDLRSRVFSALHQLAKQDPIYSDAQMLVGSAETEAKLLRQDIHKSIDTDWIDAIEAALPALDVVIRNPSVAIEDVEEILPVELSRHINDRSVKHLAQHTNLILDIQDDEVVPQKILNVYRDETYLTYENKFVNTLLSRLFVFVEKRYQALVDGRGIEQKYLFDYATSFEHNITEDGGRNAAKMRVGIELTAPLSAEAQDEENELNRRYADAVERIKKIYMAIMSYRTSTFAEKLGRSYIRPPVIRTNAILKNKNMKECLKLWEFIESFDKVGYAVQDGVQVEMPTDEYVSDLYSTVALQYVNFLGGVADSEGNRLLSKKHLFETDPEFSTDVNEQQLEDFMVYDAEYRKMVPVSRLLNNRKKLSEDERRISLAITVALRADELIKQKKLEEEVRRRAEEEARRLAEEEARRRAEEEARLEAERLEAERLAAEEAARLEAERLAAMEAARLRLEEEERRMAELAALHRAQVEEAERLEAALFASEDGIYTDLYPVCPYTRAQYLAMGRKRKKQVKQNMDKVVEYREAQKELLALQGRIEVDRMARIKVDNLTVRCEQIKRELPKSEGWLKVLSYHTKV